MAAITLDQLGKILGHISISDDFDNIYIRNIQSDKNDPNSNIRVKFNSKTNFNQEVSMLNMVNFLAPIRAFGTYDVDGNLVGETTHVRVNSGLRISQDKDDYSLMVSGTSLFDDVIEAVKICPSNRFGNASSGSVEIQNLVINRNDNVAPLFRAASYPDTPGNQHNPYVDNSNMVMINSRIFDVITDEQTRFHSPVDFKGKITTQYHVDSEITTNMLRADRIGIGLGAPGKHLQIGSFNVSRSDNTGSLLFVGDRYMGKNNLVEIAKANSVIVNAEDISITSFNGTTIAGPLAIPDGVTGEVSFNDSIRTNTINPNGSPFVQVQQLIVRSGTRTLLQAGSAPAPNSSDLFNITARVVNVRTDEKTIFHNDVDFRNRVSLDTLGGITAYSHPVDDSGRSYITAELIGTTLHLYSN